MKPKLFVIGGSGLVGGTLIQYASSNYDIHYTYNTNKILFDGIKSTQINLLEDKEKILNLIKEIQPDIVVNTAAVPSVDLCETNHEIADKLHVNATQDITKICQDINSKLIYIECAIYFTIDTLRVISISPLIIHLLFTFFETFFPLLMEEHGPSLAVCETSNLAPGEKPRHLRGGDAAVHGTFRLPPCFMGGRTEHGT